MAGRWRAGQRWNVENITIHEISKSWIEKISIKDSKKGISIGSSECDKKAAAIGHYI
jgi:hypothetical protein